jgi:glyoxylase-like metal-dependent hydrolase (beta-lactamase superfamily II)
VVVIDPGEAKEELLSYLNSGGYKPAYIILTHEHIDHVAGINFLKEHFPHCKIVCSEPCALKIIDERGNLSRYHNKPYASVPADITIDEKGPVVEWSGLAINCIPWGGHSAGGMLIMASDVIFTGDQFIKGIKTVTNLPGSQKEKVKECFEYLKNSFPSYTTLYPGHGNSFSLADLTSF